MPDPKDLETRPLPRSEARPLALRLSPGSILVLEGPDRGRRFAVLPPRLRVGTHDANDVVLADETVSKHHLVIEEQPGGWLLRDLGSRNGTFHEQVRIREAFLGPGAMIRLGSTVLRFDPPGACVSAPPSTRTEFGSLRGASPSMRVLFGTLEKVAASDVTVLITGETGTGKEVVARSLHEASRRAAGPFTVFDCSAIARELVDSALFGHKDGAFTGATAKRKGAFVSADGGTLFLDEVGELEMELQPKLLRALERREVQPLGSDQTVSVDVRVVAATHRDLKDMVRHRRFRQDLFYRLSTVEVEVPSLRERPEDIPLLVAHFLEASGAPGREVSRAAMERLAGARWTGNVRELRNVVERALAFAGDGAIDAEHLDLRASAAPAPGAAADLAGHQKLDDVEAAAIAATLRRTRWNQSRAARILGISRNTLKDKIERYGLKP